MCIGASCFQRVAGFLAGFRRHIKKYILSSDMYKNVYLVPVFICSSMDWGKN